MSANHLVVGELLESVLDIGSAMPTQTLKIRQLSAGYTQQHITAFRGYKAGDAARRVARAEQDNMRVGQVYALTAAAVTGSAGAVFLLGVDQVLAVPNTRQAWDFAPDAAARQAEDLRYAAWARQILGVQP